MESDDEINAERMLLELDFPAGETERRAILTTFARAIEPTRRMLVQQEIKRDANPHQKFAIMHLLTRCLSDLLAGGHLASHAYVSQAYCVLRPVIDSCDLIELFGADAEQAMKWILTEKGYADFAPGSVRKLLGRDKLDPVHSHFSESGSHPRFAGAQISGGMRVAIDDPDEKTAVFRIGPMWPEHPSTLLVWPFAFQLASRTAMCGHHLIAMAGDQKVASRIWLAAYRESLLASQEGCSLVLDQLDEPADHPLRATHSDPLAAVDEMLAEVDG